MEPDPGEYHTILLESLTLLAVEPLPIILSALVIIGLLYCSAMISGSEVAYFSIVPEEAEELRKEQLKSAKRVISLWDDRPSLLATILIANNFINIAIVVISTIIIEPLFPESGLLAILINVVLVTTLLVLFGEVAPKVYASSNHLKLAKFTSGILYFLRFYVLKPFVFILVRSTKFIENSLERRSDKGRMVSMEDIDQAIELTVKSSDKAHQEATLLKSIVQFGNVSVDQIMRARVDVVAINCEANFLEILETVRVSGYSRMPVYKDSFDQIQGILYAKDLLNYLDETDAFDWTKLIRSPFYVPEARKIDDLLEDFQEKRVHMAIVVDEYGGTSGIVTLEDVLEEIIGEIKDEFDDEEVELEFQRINDHTFIFEGKTMLNDVTRLAKLDPNVFDEIKGDANSLAGLILEIAGRLPRLHDEISYPPYLFKIMEVDKRRIKRVKLTIDLELLQEETH
ncbi:MAG: gliding motility-associated protein GldE [Bacteroidota bacterium]